MAAYGPAIARIRYLAGLSDVPQRTPKTITALSYTRGIGCGARTIYSYGLAIAHKESRDAPWVVYDQESTPTTNRHINAARMALL